MKIVVEIVGGVCHRVLLDQEAEVEIIDYDIEDLDPDSIIEVPQYLDKPRPGYRYMGEVKEVVPHLVDKIFNCFEESD